MQNFLTLGQPTPMPIAIVEITIWGLPSGRNIFVLFVLVQIFLLYQFTYSPSDTWEGQEILLDW